MRYNSYCLTIKFFGIRRINIICNKTCLDNVLRLFRDLNLKVLNMEITRSTETETHNACALFTLRLNKRCRVEQLIPKMNATEGVVSVEEL